MLGNLALGMLAGTLWLASGWLALIGMMAIIGKPGDQDDRILCGIALLLWPLALTVIFVALTALGFVSGVNTLVKAAVNPSDKLSNAVAKYAKMAQRIELRRLPSQQDATLRAARAELETYLGNTP